MDNIRINGTLESREVAEMVGKRHCDMLRDIDNYVRYMDEYTERKIASSDFFIRSSYQDSTGRTIPCYLITKKGCELVANKLTGAKGVQFTALYVQRFNEMEQVQQAVASGTSDKLLRAQAMLLNAQTRQFAAIMKIFGDTTSLDPASVDAFRLRTTESIFGVDVGGMLPACEETYSATEIGQMCGGISRNAIGKKAGELGLKTPEYSIRVRDVAPGHHKPVECIRYNKRALCKLQEYYGTTNG